METATDSTQPRAHSKLGLAAFFLALPPWALLCCYLTYLYIDFTDNLDLTDNIPRLFGQFGPPEFYVIAVLFCALLALLSLGLGIGSFFQKGYRKVLPILGVILTLVNCLLWLLAFYTFWVYLSFGL